MKNLSFALENGALPEHLGILGYEGDAGTVKLEFTGAEPTAVYVLDLEHEGTGAKNVLALDNENGTLSVVPDGTVQIPAGRYSVQLRTVGETVWHSNLARLIVRDAINAAEDFSPPSEAYQMEQRILEAAQAVEAAVAELTGMTAAATTLPAGRTATVEVRKEAGSPLHLQLGIPKGATGAAGKNAYQYAQEAGYSGTSRSFSTALAEVSEKVSRQGDTMTGALTLAGETGQDAKLEFTRNSIVYIHNKSGDRIGISPNVSASAATSYTFRDDAFYHGGTSGTKSLGGVSNKWKAVHALAVKGLNAPVSDGDAVNYATFKALMARVAALEARL